MSNSQGPFIVLSGPSGVGKTLFLQKTLELYPQFKNTVTYTTRSPREGEKSGDVYYFITLEEFERSRKEGRFVEWATVHDNWYATAYDEVNKLWEAKKSIIKDLDVQGAKSIKKAYPHAITIFLYPPSVESLKERILKRGDTKDIEKRVSLAEKEMAEGRSYDFKIVNDNFDEAWKEFQKIIEK